MPKSTLIRSHKRFHSRTVARKSKSGKECVTTHLPNQLALKMDGAQALHLYSAIRTSATFRRVGRCGGRDASCGASHGETAAGADLGGSSKYSNENFED